MKDLTLKHKERIDRPGFDGGAEQEQEIEIMTGQITAMFHKNQKLIQTVGRKVRRCLAVRATAHSCK